MLPSRPERENFGEDVGLRRWRKWSGCATVQHTLAAPQMVGFEANCFRRRRLPPDCERTCRFDPDFPRGGHEWAFANRGHANFAVVSWKRDAHRLKAQPAPFFAQPELGSATT